MGPPTGFHANQFDLTVRREVQQWNFDVDAHFPL
jgi:hypothetical protein